MSNTIYEEARVVYADGPIGSPAQPPKSAIRHLNKTIADAIESASIGRVDQVTWGGLAVIVGTAAGQSARVVGPDAGTHTDPVAGGTVNNIGEYIWSTSPAGWRRTGNIVREIVYASNTNSGNANAVTAASDGAFDPTPGKALITVNFTTANTGAMTLSINGETPRPLVTNTGDPIEPGYVADGMSALVQIDSDGNYRLFSYGDATAIQAATEAVLAQFNTQYLGSYASDPPTDPSGGALKQGAMYWSTTALTWFYWNGTGWGTFPFATVADGAMTAAKLPNSLAELSAMAFKLGLVSDGDYSVYVGPTGSDATGDGTSGKPYATPQKAWDSLPWLIKDKVIIRIANGTYATSSRAPLTMDRPALVYCDGKKLGRRTDAPGGVMTGSVTFVGESKDGVIFQPGSASGYIRGFYITGHVGSVGIQNITIDGQTGADSGIVAHRGSYVHVEDAVINGNSLMTFGLIGEAGGFMEALGVEVHHVVIGANAYQASTIQLSLSSNIHDCSTTGINIPLGGYAGLTTGSTCSSPVLVLVGGKFECTGTSTSRVTISGSVNVRGGDWYAVYTDVSGIIKAYPGSRFNWGAFGFSNQLMDYGADIYAPGLKSYIAPATKSTVANPHVFLGNGQPRLYLDATAALVNSAGVQVAEDYGHETYTVPGDNATIPVTVRGLTTTIQLNASAARANCQLPTTQTGRLAGTPFPDGAILYLYGTGGAVTIAEGSSADIAGGSAILGSAATNDSMLICIWSATRAKWVCGKGGVL